MKKIIKYTLSLALICVALGIVLSLVHEITLKPIAVQEQLKKEQSCREVFPDAAAFEDVDLEASGLAGKLNSQLAEDGLENETIDAIALASDESGNPLGAVYTVTTNEGYGGDITFTVGIQNDGTINGISFLSIEETAGMGMRANTEEFKTQFSGIQAEKVAYSKTGASAENEIDALSGATVTTKAVTDGVNACLSAYRCFSGTVQDTVKGG